MFTSLSPNNSGTLRYVTPSTMFEGGVGKEMKNRSPRRKIKINNNKIAKRFHLLRRSELVSVTHLLTLLGPVEEGGNFFFCNRPNEKHVPFLKRDNIGDQKKSPNTRKKPPKILQILFGRQVSCPTVVQNASVQTQRRLQKQNWVRFPRHW